MNDLDQKQGGYFADQTDCPARTNNDLDSNLITEGDSSGCTDDHPDDENQDWERPELSAADDDRCGDDQDGLATAAPANEDRNDGNPS